jgi:hypothetical protein
VNGPKINNKEKAWQERLRNISNKLPDESKDEYYANTAARIDTIIGDGKTIWMQIISAKREFELTGQHDNNFYSWLDQTYGLKLKLTPAGEFSLENEITDPQKHLIFMLKHGGQ